MHRNHSTRSTRVTFWRETFRPLGWWIATNVIWVGISYLFKFDWQSAIAGIAVLTLCFGMEAAYRITRQQEVAFRTRIEELTAQNSRDWEKKRQDAMEDRQRRAKAKVADVLRAQLGFPKSEDEIRAETGLSVEEVLFAVHSLEQEKQIHVSNNSKWCWGERPKKLKAAGWS